jgi:polyisoprenoid-binding protein YceI
MSTTQQVTAVPTGTWVTDPVHSSLGFAVKHMVVATFRGSMTDFEATLTAGEDGRARLVGVGRVASVVLQDENLSAHVQSPDFFDAERYPEVRYESSDISIEDGRLVARGQITLKGVTKPLELRGELVGPIEDPYGNTKIGVTLEGTVDRTEFGLNWNAPLPAGGGFVVGNDVRLTAELELGKA